MEKVWYSYILFNFDFSIDFIEELKGCVLFGKSIVCVLYGNFYVGFGVQQLFGLVLIDFLLCVSGNLQNLSLKLLELDNFDLGLEWYFVDVSYVLLIYWNKLVSNFIGNIVVQESLYGFIDLIFGLDVWVVLDFLISGVCVVQVGLVNVVVCLVNDILLFIVLVLLCNNFVGLGVYNGIDVQVLVIEVVYDLYGQFNDLLYQFNVNCLINQNKFKLYGWELGGQYFFGDIGFGVLVNYIVVKGDVGYNNGGDLGVDQFLFIGLSDIVNVMLMYEKYGWLVCLVWNWCDQYLILVNQGFSCNLYYVELYEQWDFSVNYVLDDYWFFSLEVINLIGEDVWWCLCILQMIVKLVDQSLCYMLGVCYKF